MLRFGSATFDTEFLTLQGEDGLTIRLTRSERLLLRHLAANPGRLLTRNQLLDAISEPGSDKSDRTIDFIINRLRAKLNDDATSPRYIATRYGEGYVWVATPQEPPKPVEGAWMVIGPIRKLGRFASGNPFEERFPSGLRHELSRLFGPNKQIAIAPDWVNRGNGSADPPEFGVELSFVPLGKDAADVVMSLRHLPTGRLIRTHRTAATSAESASGLAGLVADAIWEDQLQNHHHRQPLVVNLSEAGIAMTGDPQNWAENDRRLRALLAQNPDDPILRLFHATNLESRCVIEGPGYFLGANDPEADIAEVEATLIDILPHLQDDPVHCMSAARLLFNVGRAYHPLAMSMAERAHREGTALATSYGTIGFLRACRGDIDAAIEDYDIALGMTEPGSQYDLYLLVLKAQAQLAGDLRDDLDRTLATTYSRRAELAPFMELLCSPPGAPSPVARMALDATAPEMATAMLRYLDWSCTRHFLQRHHRRNTMEPAATLFTGRFGPQVMPAELLPEFGALIA